MRKTRFGPGDGRRRDARQESGGDHERNRIFKSRRDRLLRRELARLRAAGLEAELEDGLPARA